MNEITRLRFLKLLLAGAALAPGMAAPGAGLNDLRGDRVGWARLKTSSPHWRRHSGSDPVLMNFFRDQTTLNIDPTWYVAEADDLAELCKYPFLFSQAVGWSPIRSAGIIWRNMPGGADLFSLMPVTIPASTRTLTNFSASRSSFFPWRCPRRRWRCCRRHMKSTAAAFRYPTGGRRIRSWGISMTRAKRGHGLYGVRTGNRLAGIISMCGLQCGWDHVTEHPSQAPPGTDLACMKMMVNIYIYAMMQGG